MELNEPTHQDDNHPRAALEPLPRGAAFRAVLGYIRAAERAGVAPEAALRARWGLWSLTSKRPDVRRRRGRPTVTRVPYYTAVAVFVFRRMMRPLVKECIGNYRRTSDDESAATHLEADFETLLRTRVPASDAKNEAQRLTMLVTRDGRHPKDILTEMTKLMFPEYSLTALALSDWVK